MFCCNDKFQIKLEEDFLRSLSPPSDDHLEAVSQCIKSLVHSVAANDIDYRRRDTIVRKLEVIVKKISQCKYFL